MSTSCLINSLIPEVKINGVTLSTVGNEGLIFRPETGTYSLETPELSTTKISIETSIQERITQSNISWYRQNNILNFLRYRVLVCLGDRNPSNLDFITQRFNEYHELSGSFVDAAGQPITMDPQRYFTTSVFRKLGQTRTNLNGQQYTLPSGFALVNTAREQAANYGFIYRPYQTSDPDIFVNQGRREGDQAGFETYAMPGDDAGRNEIEALMADVVLYDKPLSQILPRDNRGDVVSRDIRQTLPANNERPQTTIVFEEIPLPEFSFDIGPDTDVSYPLNEIKHLSVYAFVYLDYSEFLRQYNFPPDETTNRLTLITGVGKNSSATLIGNKFVYEPNTATQFRKPKIPTAIIPEPDVSLLRDARRTKLDPSLISLYQQDLSTIVYKNLDGSLLKRNDTGKILHTDNYFTGFWGSTDPKGKIEYIYGFSLAKFLAQNSQFPKLYSNERTADLLLKSGIEFSNGNGSQITYKTRLRSVRTGRRVINPEAYSNSNDLGTNTKTKVLGPSEAYQENYIPEPRIVNNLSLASNPYETYFFQGEDNFSAEYENASYIESDKKYQYFSEVLVVDSSKILLIKAVKDLKKAANNLNRLFSYITDPLYGFYDPQTQRITSTLGEIEYQQESAEDYVQDQVETYLFYLELFQVETLGIEAVQILMRGLVNSSSPLRFQQAEGIIEKFASDIAAVAETYYTIQLGEQKEGFAGKTILNLNNLHEQEFPILTYKNYFSDIVERGAKKELGYEYMSGFRDDFGLKSLSQGMFLDRVLRELYKHFYLPNTDNPEYLEAYPDIQRSSGLYNYFPYVESSYKYFTPAAIYSQARSIRTNEIHPLTQLVEEFNNHEYFKPNIDEYATLLANLIKSQNKTKYLNLVGFENEPELAQDHPNRQLFNSVISSLGEDLACEISLQPRVQPPPYTPSSFEHEDSMGDEGGVGQASSAFSGAPHPQSIIGGVGDQSDLTQQFLKDVEDTYYQTAVIKETNEKNKGEEIKGGEKSPLLPIKFVFGILGELELDPQLNTLTYQQEFFNSIPALAEILQLTEGGLVRELFNDYSALPNQLKALAIMSLKPNELILGPMATRRFQAQDHDPVSQGSNTIFYYDTSTTVRNINPPFNPLYDPMKTYSKFLAFWMNFKQIIKIQFLSGFDSTTIDQNSLGRPVWQDLDKQIFDEFPNNGELLLCRISPVDHNQLVPEKETTEDTGEDDNMLDDPLSITVIRNKERDLKNYLKRTDLLDLPIYNKYFFLRAKT